MDWNDILTLFIAADTLLNPKLALLGWLVWRLWKRREKS
ncbi:hypothetical protein LCGC14_1587490 [marine sediment metagenome]|uniref:Uncharacterized protein n=1 Tax=marine sediment metagenome TaxID=412755 RepID=A0A0F9IEY4_9ZZZZ